MCVHAYDEYFRKHEKHWKHTEAIVSNKISAWDHSDKDTSKSHMNNSHMNKSHMNIKMNKLNI